MFTLFLILSILFFFTCAYNPQTPEVNTGTTLKTTGFLYKSDTTVAAYALVRFINVHDIALPNAEIHVDSIYTDSNGRYTFNALCDSEYNAFGEKDGELSFRAGIKITNGSTGCDTLADTLQPPGSLHCIVKHRYHTDNQCIIGLLPGTNRYLVPEDTIGTFSATHFSRGTYQVRFQSTLPNYLPFDTTLTIHTGINDTLSDTMYLEYDGIPTVSGLTAFYDMHSHVVNLSWEKIAIPSISGYNIYRAEADQKLTLLTQSPVTDTFYTDSNPALWQTYTYSVTAYKDGTNGPFSETETVQIIFKPEGWFKGQLHCHTTYSDGALPVDLVIQMYRAAGYDFVAVSDHNIVTPTQQFIDSSFLTIPNDEFTYGIKHVNAINAGKHFTGTIPYLLQDIINAALSVGAIPQINHPHTSEHTVMDIVQATGVSLMEIINYRHNDPVYNVALWDNVLSMGRQLYATATDDAHNYKSDFNLGWIMVQAPDLTAEAILTAIESGNFYASEGPVITGIIEQERTLRVESLDGITIDFIGKNGDILASVDSSAAQYILPVSGLYVRAEVTNVRGKVAYTQAYFP